MKIFLLATSVIVSAAAVSTAVQAADMSMPSAYDWSGFYFGANAGAAWNNTEVDSDVSHDGTLPPSVPPVLEELSNDLTADDVVFTGGAMLGYNWQHDSLVLGVEADINYLGFSGDNEISRDIDALFLSATRKLAFEADWFGTLRGRLGFAADNLLFYGTGGLAYGHLEASSDLRFYDNSGTQTDGDLVGQWKGSADDVNWGWTIGAGMEYGIDNWSLGVEYLYVDLGDADWESDNDLNTIQSYSTEGSVDYQFSVARATAKIRF